MSEQTLLPKPHFTLRQQWLLAGLTLLALALRLYQLPEQSIWFDESLSALFALQPLPVAIQSMLQEGLHHSPLYYILLRPFMAGGFNEFSLRFLSAVLGVLAVPVLAQLGRLAANPRVGLLSAVFLAANPFHVWYSQEARMYTLLILCALGSMFFFMRTFDRPRYYHWLALALFTAIGINSHHFAFFIPLVQFIFIVVTLRRHHALLIPWVGAQLLAALSLFPWLLTVLDWGQFYLSSASRQTPTGYDLLQTFWNFSLGYTGQLTLFVAMALSIFLGLLIWGIRFLYRSRYGLLLGLWLFIPPLVTFLVSLRLPTYLDRYISLSLPPFLLLVAGGIGSIRLKALQWLLLAFILGAMLTGLYRVYYDPTVYNRADWRGVGAYLEDQAATGDTVTLWYQQYLIPLGFYYHGSIPLKPIISFDKVDLPALLPAKADSQRVWVVIAHPNNSAHLMGHCQPFDMEKLPSLPAAKKWWVEHQDRLSQVKEFPCVRLEIYE